MAMVNVVSLAAHRWINWLELIGLVQRSAAIWCSCYIQSNEPGELLQWLCHDDSTMNIGIDHWYYYYCYYYLQTGPKSIWICKLLLVLVNSQVSGL